LEKFLAAPFVGVFKTTSPAHGNIFVCADVLAMVVYAFVCADVLAMVVYALVAVVVVKLVAMASARTARAAG
jgi:hypothetical protein